MDIIPEPDIEEAEESTLDRLKSHKEGLDDAAIDIQDTLNEMEDGAQEEGTVITYPEPTAKQKQLLLDAIHRAQGCLQMLEEELTKAPLTIVK